MVIISKARIIEFYEHEVKAKEALLQWYNITLLSNWETIHTIIPK